jgi:hypothetical protein
MLKVNVDGTFILGANSGAARAVARDSSQGNFLMAMTRRLPAVASTLSAEAKALREGVKMIRTVTTGGVVMETDSLELVNLWKNRPTQRSELAPILYNI